MKCEDYLIKFAVQVASDAMKLQALLAQSGYEVGLLDVITAYSDWSEEATCATWLNLSTTTDDGLVAGMLTQLTPSPDPG